MVAKLRSAYRLRIRKIKIGHGGTLDPLATGVLPILVGNGTRLAQFVLKGDKTYSMTMRLGVATDTYDSEGEVIEERDPANVSRSDVECLLPTFVGELMQVPPMFSAIKQRGKPLYKIARQGVTVDREARRVVVDSIEIVECGLPNLTLRIKCGSGFYARSLAHDLGQSLGCGAHMTGLLREHAGRFAIEDALSLDSMLGMADGDSWIANLLPLAYVLQQLGSVRVDGFDAKRFCSGNAVDVVSTPDTSVPNQHIRVESPSGSLLGLAQFDSEMGCLKPKMVFESPQSSI